MKYNVKASGATGDRFYTSTYVNNLSLSTNFTSSNAIKTLNFTSNPSAAYPDFWVSDSGVYIHNVSGTNSTVDSLSYYNPICIGHTGARWQLDSDRQLTYGDLVVIKANGGAGHNVFTMKGSLSLVPDSVVYRPAGTGAESCIFMTNGTFQYHGDSTTIEIISNALILFVTKVELKSVSGMYFLVYEVVPFASGRIPDELLY